MLDIPPPAPTQSPRVESTPSLESVSELPTLSGLDELEIPSDKIPAQTPEFEMAPVIESESPTVAHLISVDKVLQLIANGQEKLVEPYLKTVLQQLKPLLELATRKR